MPPMTSSASPAPVRAPKQGTLRARLLRLLAQGKMSELDMTAQLGCSRARLLLCLKELRLVGKVHLTGRHQMPPALLWYGIYALGPAPTTEDPLDYPCAFQLTHWPQGQACRDPLVAALFGKPGNARRGRATCR